MDGIAAFLLLTAIAAWGVFLPTVGLLYLLGMLT